VIKLMLALMLISGCYAPKKVDAPIHWCVLTGKTDLCVPSDTVQKVYDKF